MEISEKERLRRRLERLEHKKQNPRKVKGEAQSFRLGNDHTKKLRTLASRSGLPQVELLRLLIDKRWLEVEEARASK